MNPFNSNKEQPGDYYPEPMKKEKPSTFKILIGTLGALFAVSHIGLVGYLMREPYQVPTINIPKGDYSSYELNAGPDGYSVKYKANDPTILESDRSLELDKDKRGWFGPTTERRREFRRDQYTMDGIRNIGGATTLDSEGKQNAKSVECIVADAGARSQGAMAGSALATGVAVPAVMNIPYIGWLAAGWVSLLGNNIGSSAGSLVNSAISDC